MLRILYVEDNAANLSLVHRVARLGGHEVVNRTSGQSTLNDFDRIRPDLVLMDIQLEGEMDGLEVVRKLREQGHKVPIIAVTAYAMKGDREKAIEAGCDDYLPKPLPIKELVSLLEHYQALADKRKTGEIPLTESSPVDSEPSKDAAKVKTDEVQSVKKVDVGDTETSEANGKETDQTSEEGIEANKNLNTTASVTSETTAETREKEVAEPKSSDADLANKSKGDTSTSTL